REQVDERKERHDPEIVEQMDVEGADDSGATAGADILGLRGRGSGGWGRRAGPRGLAALEAAASAFDPLLELPVMGGPAGLVALPLAAPFVRPVVLPAAVGARRCLPPDRSYRTAPPLLEVLEEADRDDEAPKRHVPSRQRSANTVPGARGAENAGDPA